jgi:hypothetical protein
MRTRLSVLAILAGMTLPAAAHSPQLPDMSAPVSRDETERPIDLSVPETLMYRNAAVEEDDSPLLDRGRTRYESAPHAIPSIHIGSFHLELGGDSTKTHFAHYTLDGVKVLGGGISGSIDGRSARIAISWPSGS